MEASGKMRFITVVPVLALVFNYHILAQGVGDPLIMNSELMALTDTEQAIETMEMLESLAANPVSINFADEEEIARLFFLSEFQVKVLADHVRQSGNIVSVYEIALLPGFDRSTAMMMEPYIRLEASKRLSATPGGKTTVLLTAMFRGAVTADDSSGMRSRLRFSHKGSRLSYGLTAENDAGEPYTFAGQPGTDFLSAYLLYDSRATVARVIAGDYTLRFGEGLLFNSNAWQGGWLSSPSFLTGRTVVSPYTSTDENRFFRGAAAVVGSLTGGVVIFGSSNAIDARVKYDEDDGSAYVSNLVSGGIHSTPSGREARNALTENIFGTHFTAGGDRVRAGITAAYTLFSLPLRPDTTDGINIHSFYGDRLFNTGLDIRASLDRITLFGEAGYSHPGSWAMVAGARAVPSSRMTINMLTRYIDPSYHVFHSSVSSSDNGFEIAGNIIYEAASHLFLTAGADLYRHNWLSYRSSSPSMGVREEVRVDYNPSENLSCRAGYNYMIREYDESTDTGLPGTMLIRRHQLSLLGAWAPLNTIRLTSRATWCTLPDDEERGYMLCQDLLWQPHSLPVRLWFRYALFTTDSWDSRIYVYENDMLLASSMPPLYGNGTRLYLMTEWSARRHILIRFKYALTARDDAGTTTYLNEVRGQCRIVF